MIFFQNNVQFIININGFDTIFIICHNINSIIFCSIFCSDIQLRISLKIIGKNAITFCTIAVITIIT